MAGESIRVSTVIPTTAVRIYRAWMDPQEHSFMTGAPATVEPHVGGHHTAWGGYITGQTLALEPYRRIVQSWRSTDFADDDADSRLEVRLEGVGEGTRVTIDHSNLPVGQGRSLEEGWRTHYLAPMADYFSIDAEDLSFQVTESGPPPSLPAEETAMGSPPPRSETSPRVAKGKPKAKATPKAKPKAKATPKAKPKAKATPKAKPKATPKAKAKPKATPKRSR